MTLTEPTSTPLSTSPHSGGIQPGWLWVVRVVTVAVALGLILAGAVAVASTFFTRRTVETRSFAGTTSLRLSTDTGDVRVHAAPAGSATVVQTTTTSDFRTGTHGASVQDGVLRLTGSCSDAGSGPRVLGRCAVDFDIAIPPDVTVQVGSQNGDVRVSGIDGAVVMTSSNGDVQAAELNGSVKMSSDNGDVEGDDLSGGSVSAHSDNGDVDLQLSGVPSDVTATSSNGDVTVEVPTVRDGYDIIAETDHGDRSVTAPASDASARKIEARSSNGDVEVRLAQ